jgi:small subunit ribosomal protein S1
MMFMKEKQQSKKKASKVRRIIPFANRTTLSDLVPGSEVNGIVISLLPFGAYVDIGTECDGLLHISQIRHDIFVEHPRQVLSPGDNVTVCVRSVNPEARKLHLTMLPPDILAQQLEDSQSAINNDNDDRIQLHELQVDDELWGEIQRVTAYGAYVEVGAVVPGWLHFMDHPAFGWSNGEPPSAYMKRGDRVRVWVAQVDPELKRVKLTALRPAHLPGPRRER